MIRAALLLALVICGLSAFAAVVTEAPALVFATVASWALAVALCVLDLLGDA